MLRNLVLGAFAAILATWTYIYVDHSREHERELAVRDARIATLESENHLLDQEVARLEVANRFLRLDHRVARIEVIDQSPIEGGDGAVETTIVFTEIDPEGEAMGEGETMVIRGKQLYIDSMVVKFDDSFIEAGDALRGTSVAVFKRLFSDAVAPEAGIPIDSKNKHPLPFRGDDLPDPMYADLFDRIWDYANDPEAAAELGVRAIQGEAPSIEARPGKVYRVELRQSGGLTIRAER
jgi:hypothetical protein